MHLQHPICLRTKHMAETDLFFLPGIRQQSALFDHKVSKDFFLRQGTLFLDKLKIC